MPIKLNLLVNQQDSKQRFPDKSAKRLWKEFSAEASICIYQRDKFWEELLERLTPTRFAEVQASFSRGQVPGSSLHLSRR